MHLFMVSHVGYIVVYILGRHSSYSMGDQNTLISLTGYSPSVYFHVSCNKNTTNVSQAHI